MNASEFQQQVLTGLAPHRAALVDALRQLIGHGYPPEVERLEFEIFPQTFTSGWPVRAFFMDRDRTEFFLFEGEKALYPSPIDPGLLETEAIYAEDLEDALLASEPESDPYQVAEEATVDWFKECWAEAGGAEFGLHAEIAVHDGERWFDLVRGRWFQT